MTDKFDFRWGIPALDDKGYTFIPGYILRNYAKMNIKPAHMMFIAHLSSYKYNTPNSEARPSLRTIADLMGFKSEQAVRDIIAKLISGGVLTVFENPGRPNLYDFSVLSARCLVLDKENLTPQGFLTPTPQENLTPPLKDSLPEETEIKAEIEKQESLPSAKTADGEAGASENGKTHSSKKESPHTIMKNAILGAFGWDAAHVADWGVIDAASKKLRKVEFPPGELPALYAYCASKFDKFGPGCLASHVAAYYKEKNNHATTQSRVEQKYEVPASRQRTGERPLKRESRNVSSM